jgi:hypothetical protein
MAVAGLGEITGGLGPSISKHTGELLATFTNAIDDNAIEVASNAIYALGLLLETTMQDLSRYTFIKARLILVNMARFLPNFIAFFRLMHPKMQGITQWVVSPE